MRGRYGGKTLGLYVATVVVCALFCWVSPAAGQSLQIVGSDTLAPVLERWAVTLARDGIVIDLQATGSSAAPTALIEGTAQLGAMSRAMTSSEQLAFSARYGAPALEFVVAFDAVAAFVHPSNPLAAIDSVTIDAVFGANPRCGGGTAFTAWSQVIGNSEDFSARRIVPLGRSSSSGTAGFFQRVALCGGDYGARVRRLAGNGLIVALVAQDANAIGYASVSSLTPEVKVLAIRSAGEAALLPTPRMVTSGRYPWSRVLRLYAPPLASNPSSQAVVRLLQYAISGQGQQAVARAGLIPLPDRNRQQVQSQLSNLLAP